MVTTELFERDVQSGTAARAPEGKLALEMEQILEEAEQKQGPEDGKTAQWGYRIPFAGVRYYTF